MYVIRLSIATDRYPFYVYRIRNNPNTEEKKNIHAKISTDRPSQQQQQQQLTHIQK